MKYPECQVCCEEALDMNINYGVSEPNITTPIYGKGNKYGNYQSVFF
jgi:hypothetical protein